MCKPSTHAGTRIYVLQHPNDFAINKGDALILAKIGNRVKSTPQVRFMGIATSRFRLMLCESCASGEDRGDIHIDTEVLNEIVPLA